MIKAACLQMATSDTDSKQNRITHAEQMIDKVADADLILLPEIWNASIFAIDEYSENAEPINGETISRIAAKAREVNAYILAGSIIERAEDGSLSNTSVLLNPKGENIATYRKIHLVGHHISGTISTSEGGEKAVMKRGQEIVAVKTDIGVLGLSTCYDIHFPELYRKLAIEHGVEMFLHPAAWPITKVDMYFTLMKARAAENLCWLVGCLSAGVSRSNVLQGYSVIIEPEGAVVACGLRGEECIIRGEIDISRIYDLRKSLPVYKDRVLPI
ncbi:nitrilase-related carbon-nitrogen hydrolase [Chloroflexota bacterium]